MLPHRALACHHETRYCINICGHVGLGSGITDEEFQNAVYSFDIGQNDISLAFSANLTYERILEEAIPATITRIRNAVTVS